MTKLYYSYTMEYSTVCVSIDENHIIVMLGEKCTLQKIMILYTHTYTYIV